VFCRPREAKFSHDNPFGQPGRLTLRPSLADRQREGREKREKGQGNPALPVQQGSLGKACCAIGGRSGHPGSSVTVTIARSQYKGARPGSPRANLAR
jgi:hypothetical protein